MEKLPRARFLRLKPILYRVSGARVPIFQMQMLRRLALSDTVWKQQSEALGPRVCKASAFHRKYPQRWGQ